MIESQSARCTPLIGATLWVLTVLFAMRVAAQAVQFWLPQPFLPSFEKFQGSSLPYAILFSSQILILGAMVSTCLTLQSGKARRSQRWKSVLFWSGWVYMAGSILRILVGLTIVSAPEWFRAWISGAFHLVLAAFVLTAAYYHKGPVR